MQKQSVVLLLALVAAVAMLYASHDKRVDAFAEWKAQQGVNWAPEEDAYRRIIFEKNLKEIEAHNADPYQTYLKGINQFTAFTQEEFEHIFLGAVPPTD